MMISLDENQILGMIWKCSLCGFCPKEFECPAYDEDARWESSYARGKVAIVHGMLKDPDKGFQNSSLAKERLFSCTGCAHCHYICPSDVDIPKIITYGKKMLVEANNYPKDHKIIAKNIQIYGNPFGEQESRDHLFPELKANKDAETVYFPGCMAIYRSPEIAITTIEILKIFGEKIKLLENDICCSGILYRIGQVGLMAQILKPMFNELHENPPKQIIFTCPGCLTSFKNIYALEFEERFKKTKFLHFSEYLNQHLIKLNGLESKVKNFLNTQIDGPIIWHDPCHLARGLEVYDEPRTVLNTLKIPFEEFEQNKKDSNCCGSGSGVRSAYPDLAEKSTKRKLDEVIEKGVKVILTACPFCEYQFQKVIDKYKFDIEVLDLNTLIINVLS